MIMIGFKIGRRKQKPKVHKNWKNYIYIYIKWYKLIQKKILSKLFLYVNFMTSKANK